MVAIPGIDLCTLVDEEAGTAKNSGLQVVGLVHTQHYERSEEIWGRGKYSILGAWQCWEHDMIYLGCGMGRGHALGTLSYHAHIDSIVPRPHHATPYSLYHATPIFTLSCHAHTHSIMPHPHHATPHSLYQGTPPHYLCLCWDQHSCPAVVVSWSPGNSHTREEGEASRS